MDGQSVKTTERGGVRGFDSHKRVKGRKRHILVDTLGLPIANRVEPASISDRRAGARLLAGLRPLFPAIRTVMADAGHESRKLARELIPVRSNPDLFEIGVAGEGAEALLGERIPCAAERADDGVVGVEQSMAQMLLA